MRRTSSLTILIALSACSAQAAPDPSRDVLWAAVKTCLLAKTIAGRTFPCLEVDPGGPGRPGTAVMRAPGQPTHVVVMPTDTVPGLESPLLRGPRGVIYWRAALDARRFVAEATRGRVPVADVGLAVNSARGRSQDQLHMHVDGLKPTVLAALRTRGRDVRAGWTPFPVALAGARYLALRVPAGEGERFNPFSALARLPGRRPDLRGTSIAALATPPGDPEPGYYLFAYHAPSASAEDLMDHACSATASTAR